MRGRTRLGALVLAIMGLTSSASVATAARPAQAPAPAATSAVTELAGCLSAQGAGDLLVLVDQSQSLRTTDPAAGRVTAATFLLERLARSAEQAGYQVEVALAGFDATYGAATGWRRLDTASVPALVADVQQFAQRDDGIDTDYHNAVAGARDALRERARGEPRCQAVLWFTDGQLDVETRRSEALRRQHGTTKEYAPGTSLADDAGAAEAERIGREALCRDGGVADQLRAADVLTIAIGLGGQQDFSLLRSVATGSDGASTTCGRAPSEVVGDFYAVGDVDDLVFAFNVLADPQRAPRDQETGICAGAVCSERHSFVLDASIRTVQVLADAKVPAEAAGAIEVVLLPPAGGEARFPLGAPGQEQQVALGGQTLRFEGITDSTAELTLEQVDRASWTGQWSLVFVDRTGAAPGARARTQVRITGDLVPSAPEAASTELRTSDDVLLVLGLASETTGEPVDPSEVLGVATVSAELVGADGSSTTIRSAQDVDALGPVPVSLEGVPPGPAVLRLTLSVVTAALPATAQGPAVPGTPLADRVVDVPLQVLPPLDFPRVGERVDFGEREGTGPFRAPVTVTGPGCVWFDGASLDASPEGVGTVTVVAADAGSADGCVVLKAGETREIPLTLSLAEAGNGTVAGSLVAHLAPEGQPDRALTTPVAFVGDLLRPSDPGRFWLVAVLSALLGVLLPLAFLYLARRWSSKVPGQPLLVGTVDVRVTADDVLRDGAPLTLSAEDGRYLQLDPAGVRSLRPAPGVDLVVRLGRNPAAAARVHVRAPGATVLTSAGGDDLPLTVHGSWVALLDGDGAGRVLLLMSTHVGPEWCAEAARRIRDVLPRAAAPSRTGAGAPTVGSWVAPAGPGPDAGLGWTSDPTPAGPPSDPDATASGWWHDGPSR